MSTTSSAVDDGARIPDSLFSEFAHAPDFAREPGEELLMSAYAGCKKNKASPVMQGVIFLTTKGIAWCPLGSTTPVIQLQYAHITSHQYVKDKPLMKLTVAKTRSYVFEFTSPSSALQEKDAFRDILDVFVPKKPAGDEAAPPAQQPAAAAQAAAAPPPERRLSVEEARQRADLLAKDANLRDLYVALVKADPPVISEADFWQSRQHLLVKETTQAERQRRATSSAMIADVQPSQETASAAKYVLTPSIIRAIFQEFPAVRVYYEELVPDQMTEKEFWTKYLNTKHLYTERLKKRKAGQSGKLELSGRGVHDEKFLNMVRQQQTAAALAEKDGSSATAAVAAAQRQLDDAEELVPPMSDVNLQANHDDGMIDHEEGYGLPDDPLQYRSLLSKDSSTSSLITRYNRHSSLVLDGDGDARRKKAPKGKEKVRRRAPVVQQQQDEEAPVPLNVGNLEQYYSHRQQTAPVAAATTTTWSVPAAAASAVTVESDGALSVLQELDEHLRASAASVREAQQRARVFAHGVMAEKSGGGGGGNSDDGVHSWTPSADVHTHNVQTLDALGIAREQHSELLATIYRFIARGNELLRHFWAAYPISTRASAEKVDRIVAVINKLYDEVEAYREALSSDLRGKLGTTIMQMTRCFDKAIERHQAKENE